MAGIIRIKKQDKLFTRLRWACLAVARNGSTRPALTLLCTETKDKRLQFTGCDGNRLHRFTSDSDSKFKDSGCNLYKISKITKSELSLIKSDCESPYPDVDNVIPEYKESAKSITVKYAAEGASLNAMYAAAIRLLPPEWALDAAFFAELLSGNIVGKEVTINIFNGKYQTFAICEAENLIGLLMPIKIRTDDLIIKSSEEILEGSELLN